MASTASLEGVKKTIFFPFLGKGWVLKLLIGSALNLANYIIPIVPLIPFYGYVGQIAKHVIHNDEEPALPEWNDWGLLFTDGIKFFGVSILFSLPGILAIILGYVLMFAMNFTFLLVPSFYSSSQSMGPEIFAVSMTGMLAGLLVIFFGMLLLFLAGLFLPPAMGHLIAKGEFAAAFRIKEWWPIFKANFSGYILALLLLSGVYMAVLGLVYMLYFTVILCILMPFALMAATFIMSAIRFSLIGVVYRDGLRKLAEAG